MRSPKDIITEIAYDFSEATGLAVLVVDIHGNEISPQFNFTPFCQQIRTDSSLKNYCQRCDMCGGIESLKNRKPNFYRCHTGLIDFSMPLIIKGALVGFIQCGQARVSNLTDFPEISQVRRSDSISPVLQDMYSSIPLLKSNKILSSANILGRIIECSFTKEFKVSESYEYQPDSHQTVTIDKTARDKERIRRAIQYVDENLSNELSLDEVADVIHLSACYFSRLFKQKTGTGFNTYKVQRRMEKAKELLVSTNWSIDKIASYVGYKHMAYFVKQFNQSFGYHPVDFTGQQKSLGPQLLSH